MIVFGKNEYWHIYAIGSGSRSVLLQLVPSK